MSIFKCKMCGGDLEINPGVTVAECEYCGTQQTLPKLDDEKRANLYDRANHFRRNNEFDKAMGIYEQILNEDNSDSEAYWSIVLCRYGIEYVEDPSSHKRVPTVNRAQYTSIFDDDNYKSAIEYADSLQKSVYEAEAKAINEIQKGILAISQKEEPFDVFICYKETDNSGRRTPDSVLANDLYHQLTQEGFKVFFARITLEDKLGSAYEPYIFAALNSAKVMVVLGTKPEFFNAVWVKNEWSRYLALIKNGAKKMLIPAYKDMDPYDLPEEFSHLQAQDMSKLGFMQDLIRGIKKIAGADEPAPTVIKETVVTTSSDANTAPLLERVFMFLEDGDWNSANEYCEKVLDIEPKNAQAYLGKLMAELQVKKRDSLKDCEKPFDKRDNYLKIVRFADDALKTKLAQDIEHIKTRNENERVAGIYSAAAAAMKSASTENAYKDVANKFATIREYKDAAELEKQCLEKAEIARKDAILGMAKSKMTENVVSNYEAIALLETIPGWKDADEKIIECKQKIEKLKADDEAKRVAAEAYRLEQQKQDELKKQEAERKAKRNKKIAIIAAVIALVVITFIVVLNSVIIPNGKYNDAISLMNEGKYEEAIPAFEALGEHKDSIEKIKECTYNNAVALMNGGKYEEAINAFNEIGEYKESAKKIKECNYAILLKSCKVGDYVFFGAYEQDNDTENGKEDIEWLVLAKENNRALVVSKYALNYKPYNTSSTNVTWETCTLRKWLNNEFFNAAFADEEKEIIPTMTISADKNPEYSTNPGNATQDKVFLLSILEAKKFFSSDSERMCTATQYARKQGAGFAGKGETCWWLLRSPSADSSDFATGVISDGSVDEVGLFIIDFSFAVRPAMWINLN